MTAGRREYRLTDLPACCFIKEHENPTSKTKKVINIFAYFGYLQYICSKFNK